jgi:hypothetical protein
MHQKTNIKCRSGDVVRSNINPELFFRRALSLTLCRDDVTVENDYLILLDYDVAKAPKLEDDFAAIN